MGSKDNLHPYISFHAGLRTAHQAFVGKLEETARGMLRTHLEAATSQFAMNMYAHMPDPGDPMDLAEGEEDEAEDEGPAGGAGDGDAEVRARPVAGCWLLCWVRMMRVADGRVCADAVWLRCAGFHAHAGAGARADDGA